MKKLFTISLIFLFACQKEVIQPSLSSQVSSNAVVSEKGHESFPMEYLAWNECTHEWVRVSLVIEYRFNYFVTKDDFHANAHYQVKEGWGIGQTSGDTYKLVGQIIDVEKFKNYPTTENETFRVTSKLTFVNKGNNWVTESVRLRKVEDDGTITLDVEEEKSYCR